MALIILTGLPCSGRTTRSLELMADFQSRLSSPSSSSTTTNTTLLPTRILHLTNASLHLPRSTFSSQTLEKPARSAFLSHAMRSLASDAVVITDGGAGTNIKGFRYQLWCAAREVGVKCINVMCASERGRCRTRWERRRGRKDKVQGQEEGEEEDEYDEKTFEELLQRYEEPSDMVRWDKPLFVVADGVGPSGSRNDDIETSNQSERDEDGDRDGRGEIEPSEVSVATEGKEEWEKMPFDEIWEAVVSGKVQKAPDVVTPTRATTTNYLSLLESTTQSVLSTLFHHLSTTASLSGPIVLSLPSPLSMRLRMVLPTSTANRTPTMAGLQRLRRQFVKMHSKGFATTNELGRTVKREGGGGGGSGSGEQGVLQPNKDDSLQAGGGGGGGGNKGIIVGQRLGRRAPISTSSTTIDSTSRTSTTPTSTSTSTSTSDPGAKDFEANQEPDAHVDVDASDVVRTEPEETGDTERSIAKRFVAWLEEALIIGSK